MFYSFGVFTFRRMSKTFACNIFFKRLGSLLANKKDVTHVLALSFPCYALPLTVIKDLGHLEVVLLTCKS